ncbi:MAG: pilus assembly protein TadG-related protein, partial [Acidimicrobiales bacterium]
MKGYLSVRRRNQRGAVLPMAAAAIVIAMIASALAVDIGLLAQDRRRNQKVADLAALDAVRALPADPTSAARASATRNGFTWSAVGYSLIAEPLNDAGAVVGPASATKVRVTAKSPRKPVFPFVGNRQRIITAHGVAKLSTSVASFTIGSSVATIDTTRSQILNRLLNNVACPPPAPPCNTANLSLAGYQGLAASNVNLDTLRTEMGFAALTPDQFLSQNMNAADIVGSTAGVLDNTPGNDTAVANLNVLEAALRARVLPIPPMNLGQLITVAPGSEGSALASSFNVLQLVTGTAQVANGTNAVSIPNLSIAPV